MATHTEFIRDALLRGEKITALDALRRWGCFRLGARIHELKHEPYFMNIKSEYIAVPASDKHVVQYSLERITE